MIVAGFGFTSRASVNSLHAALAATGHLETVDVLAAPADKAVQAPLRALADALALGIHPVPQDRLAAQQTQTRSTISQTHRDTGSVAEAAALAAAGAGATLIVTRRISDDRMATCAIAKGADT